MKREFNAILTDLNGKPLGNMIDKADEADSKKTVKVFVPMTLSSVSVEALLMPYQDEQNLSGEDKVKRFKLAKKIHGTTEPLEVEAEEVALLKRLIAKAYAPVVVGQAYELLERDPVAQPQEAAHA